MTKLPKSRKQRSVMIRLDLYKWILEEVKKGRFWNVSHAIEYSLIAIRDMEKEEKHNEN